MITQKGHWVGAGLAMAWWFAMVQWASPLIGSHPLAAARLSILLVIGAVGSMLYYRSKTTDRSQRKLLGRMLAYTAAGVAVALASGWA